MGRAVQEYISGVGVCLRCRSVVTPPHGVGGKLRCRSVVTAHGVGVCLRCRSVVTVQEASLLRRGVMAKTGAGAPGRGRRDGSGEPREPQLAEMGAEQVIDGQRSDRPARVRFPGLPARARPTRAQAVQDARLGRFPCLWTRPLGGIGVAATSAAIWLFGRAGAGQRGAA